MRRLWTLPADLLGATVKYLSGARTVGLLPGEVLFASLPACSLAARLLARLDRDAITIGRFVLCRALPSDSLSRHEREHVRQWNRWGPAFPLAYGAAALWSKVRGHGWYEGNAFERAARGAE